MVRLLGNKFGFSLVEVVTATAVLATSAGVISSVAQIAGSIKRENIENNMKQAFLDEIRDSFMDGLTCNQAVTAVVNSNPNQLQTQAGAVRLWGFTGPQSAIDFDTAGNNVDGSHPFSLFVDGIRDGGGSQIIADPLLGDAALTLIPKYRVQVVALQLVRLVLIGAIAGSSPAQSEYLGVVKVRVRRVGSDGVSFLRPGDEITLDVGTVVVAAVSDSGNANFGNITACSGNASVEPQAICLEFGCTWVPAGTPRCQCPETSLSCGPNEVLLSVTNGVKTCAPIGGADCLDRQYLRGVGINRSICESYPGCPSVGPGAITWRVGPNVCANTVAVPAMADSASQTVNGANIVQSVSAGTAQVSCRAGQFHVAGFICGP